MTAITLTCRACATSITTDRTPEAIHWDADHEARCDREAVIVMPCGAVVQTLGEVAEHGTVCRICSANGEV